MGIEFFLMSMDIPHQLTAASLYPFMESLLGTTFNWDRGAFCPATVFTSILKRGVAGSRGYKQTLIELKDNLGDELGWFDKPPNPSGLCQARHQFTYQRCDAVFYGVQEACLRLQQHSAHQYAGLNLYAIDMTRCNIPASKAVDESFWYSW